MADPPYHLKAEVGEGDTNWKSVITTVFESLFGVPSEKVNLVDPITNSKEEAQDIEHVIASLDKEYSPITTHCFMCEDATLLNIIKLKSTTILHFSTHGFSHSEQRGVNSSFWADTWTRLVLAGVTHTIERTLIRLSRKLVLVNSHYLLSVEWIYETLNLFIYLLVYHHTDSTQQEKL